MILGVRSHCFALPSHPAIARTAPTCGICLLYGPWNANILPTWHRTWHVWEKTHRRPCDYHLMFVQPLPFSMVAASNQSSKFKNWYFQSLSINYPFGGCSCCLISAFNVPASLNASSDPMSSDYSRYKWASVLSRAMSSGNLFQTHTAWDLAKNYSLEKKLMSYPPILMTLTYLKRQTAL